MSDDLKELMQSHFLKYASYVILDRAIPHIEDGLKPVQRRFLYMLWLMDDGKLHKVANVAGQTMIFHPHGDGPITDALVNLSNKGYLLEQQGNFGNLFTGDPAAASRYIETRLSPLAKETLFNPDLTQTIASYDGRNQEPVTLPAKLPFLILQGAEGIAVGMSTHILPHNFSEVLKAQIALLEGKEPDPLYPDFQTGGIMDPSEYNDGKGKLRLRIRYDLPDPKTLVIREICYGTTTESLIRSIDEAAKKGKIKIESIHDYTAEKVEIEIKLARGQSAKELLPALYAFTQCEVVVHSQIVVIKDNLPWEPTLQEVLVYHLERLQYYLKTELTLEKTRLLQKIFEKTLEQIFIENRLYKPLENLSSVAAIDQSVAVSLEPFHSKLSKIPEKEDRDKLLAIPIRKISRFDLDQNQKEISQLHQSVTHIENQLKNIKKFTIQYLQKILDKYQKGYPRKTSLQEIEEIDKKAVQIKAVKVGFDETSGFIGTKVSGTLSIEATNFDKLLIVYKNGTYSVIHIPEKMYLQKEGETIIYVGVADKKTVFSCVYCDPKTHFFLAKRFIISKFILDKVYRYLDEGVELKFFTAEPNVNLTVHLLPKLRQKVNKLSFSLENILIKSPLSKGTKISSKPVKKIVQSKENR